MLVMMQEMIFSAKRLLAVALIVALGSVAAHAQEVQEIGSQADGDGDQLALYKQLTLFGDVLERVRAEYVDAPSDEELIEAAMTGMLASLDPHSAYLPPKGFEDMQHQTPSVHTHVMAFQREVRMEES